MSSNASSPDMSQLQMAFEGATLKVERAKRHIDEFKTILDNLAASHSDGLSVTEQRDGIFLLDLPALGPEAKFLPVVAGDAIHNMRSAFDHVWMGLWRAAAAPGFGYFPFHETWKNLKDAIAQSPVKMAFPDTERLIIDHVKPCGEAGGDRPLWAITKYDKIDKHNLIIPLVRIDWVERLTIKSATATMEMTNVTFSKVDHLARFPGSVEYKQKGKMTFEIVFPEDNVLPREPLLPTLVYMAEATDAAVKLFRKAFL